MRKCDSDLIKEAAHSKGNSTKQVGLELTALRLCGHRSRTDLVTKFNVSRTVRSAVN
jgi:hypothetical protein